MRVTSCDRLGILPRRHVFELHNWPTRNKKRGGPAGKVVGHSSLFCDRLRRLGGHLLPTRTLLWTFCARHVLQDAQSETTGAPLAPRAPGASERCVSSTGSTHGLGRVIGRLGGAGQEALPAVEQIEQQSNSSVHSNVPAGNAGQYLSSRSLRWHIKRMATTGPLVPGRPWGS